MTLVGHRTRQVKFTLQDFKIQDYLKYVDLLVAPFASVKFKSVFLHA